MSRRFRSLLVVAGVLLLASARPASAQFPWAGARETGMGGAAVAAVADNSAAWVNPAALASLTGWNFQLLAGATAQNRNNLVGTITGLTDLPWDAIVAGDRPDLVPVALAGIANLARPGTAVVSSGTVGLVASYKGFALSIGDVPYAGIYPVVDLQHVVPGGGPDNGLAYNTTGLYLVGLSAREVRLAYGHAFLGGMLEVGGAARYVSGVTYFAACGIAGDLSCQGKDLSELIHDAFQENDRTTNEFAFDLGARLNLGIVKVGVVGTSLNQPHFDVADVPGSPGTVPLPRQVRGGVSVDPLPFLSIAADGDFIKSETLAPGVQSQQVSLGVEGKIPLFALRVGATRDLAAVNPTWVYTAGVGFGIPIVSVDVSAVWGPTGGFNYKNPDREMLGGAASVKVHF
ncbi:MAG TPA: conjugal transfer protein TraF [Thermoanaerobaculia bacterium]|nr:conjugal transfer protein TraF [Thermoanaerobaculia bacterium]